MVKTTRPQRLAIKKLYDRAPMYACKADAKVDHRISYRKFRKTVMATFGCDGAVVVKWAGMFVCIETDGYTHT